MDFPLNTFICGAAALCLAGCGGGGGGGGGTNIGAASSLDYDPVYASSGTPSVSAALPTTGTTGLMAFYDPLGDRIMLRNVRIATNGDGSVGFLTIGNGDRITLPFNATNGIFGTPQRNFFFGITDTGDMRDVLTNILPNGDLGLAEGFVGIETPIENLPSGSTTYDGDFSVSMRQTDLGFGLDGALGEISITADFGTGNLSGTLVDGFTTPFGTISGNTQGNGILGVITLADSYDYSGQIDIVGKTFGADGATLAGVMGSNGITQDATGDTYLVYGTFDAER